MINNRLLKEFKSEDNHTVIIKDISCEEDSCGQEVLKISTIKILRPYQDIVKNYDKNNKTLEIEGQLNLNSNKEYYTNLVGFISNEEIIKLTSPILEEGEVLNDTYRSPTSHSIEEIRTRLNDEIEIEFNNEYTNQPHIIITIDKEYEELYRSYSTTFVKNNFNTKYTGVKIKFNNLKVKNSYPEIGICIVGDQIESYYDGIVKTETTANIHFSIKDAEEANIHITE